MHQLLTLEKRNAQLVSRERITAISVSHEPVALESVQPGWVEALKAFYSRWSTQLMIGGEAIAIAPVWPNNSIEHLTSAIVVTIGDALGELRAPRALVERWLFRVDPQVDLARLPAGHVALLLEIALSGELARMEKHLGCQITVEAIENRDSTSSTVPFSFTLTGKEGTHTCTFHLDDPDRMEQVSRLLAASGSTTARLPLDFTLEVCLQHDAVTITAAELESLAPGDVVLFDDFDGAVSGARIVISNWFVAPVELTPDGARLIAPLTRFSGSKWEWVMNEATHPGTSQTLEDSDLENLLVTLVFELGRTALPLGEVKELAPGAIVPLGDSTNATVDVVANGKRVGRGEIVRIGDSLGVRLVRMINNA